MCSDPNPLYIPNQRFTPVCQQIPRPNDYLLYIYSPYPPQNHHYCLFFGLFFSSRSANSFNALDTPCEVYSNIPEKYCPAGPSHILRITLNAPTPVSNTFSDTFQSRSRRTSSPIKLKTSGASQQIQECKRSR